MKTLITISIIVFTISVAAFADVIVKYEFGVYPNGTLVPSIQADHISASNFGYVGDGTASYADHSGNGQAYQIDGGWPGSEYSDYFRFTVTVASGWSLNLNSRCIWFDARTTNMNGPNLGRVTYLGNPETILMDDIEIGGSRWYTYKTNPTPMPTGLTGTIEFRIYGKDATAYGQFTIDNVILNGTFTELPQPAEPTENIDPENSDRQYAYGENVGWINFEPDVNDTGAIVSRERVEGYIWAENIGWINLDPNYGGVFNNGYGQLSGYAWGENVGWINFNPNYGGVAIDINGNFSGWAWGENIGWINFNSSDLYGKGVKVCVVNYFDLKTMAQQWLSSGSGLTADLKPDSTVDFEDFAVLADYWFDYCPGNWPL